MRLFLRFFLVLAFATAAPAFAINSVGNGSTSCPVIGTGTFASRPTAVSVCQQYYATDLGTGMFLVSNGAVWKPAGGIGVLAQSHANSHSVTGTLSETNLAAIKVPGGLMSAAGSLRITTLWSVNNNANNKQVVLRYGTASGTTGTQYMDFGLTTVVTARFQTQIGAANSLSAQKSSSAFVSFGSSSSAAITSAINTAADSWVNLTGILANVGDTITLEGYTVEWIEP